MNEIKRTIFEIKQNAVGRYYFVFKSLEGKPYIISKSFADRSSLEICIAQIREKAKVAGVTENYPDGIIQPPLFHIITDKGMGYYFVLIGFEGEVIFSSESFAKMYDCICGIEVLKNQSLDAGIVDSV